MDQSKILKSGLFSDCSFRVGDKIIKSHKAILAGVSTVFESIFYSLSTEADHIVSLSHDIKVRPFEHMLKFIYTNDTDIRTTDEALEIIYIANKYLIMQLLDKAVQFIQRTKLELKLSDVFRTAKKNNVQKLLDHCYKEVFGWCREKDLRTFPNVPSDMLNPEDIGEFLIYFRAYSSSDVERFKFLVWCSNTCTDGWLLERLKQTRFLTITASDFAKVSVHSKMLKPEEILAILMSIHVPNNAKYPMPKGFGHR